MKYALKFKNIIEFKHVLGKISHLQMYNKGIRFYNCKLIILLIKNIVRELEIHFVYFLKVVNQNVLKELRFFLLVMKFEVVFQKRCLDFFYYFISKVGQL